MPIMPASEPCRRWRGEHFDSELNNTACEPRKNPAKSPNSGTTFALSPSNQEEVAKNDLKLVISYVALVLCVTLGTHAPSLMWDPFN